MKSKKECVKLRCKLLSNGVESLYLDIYLDGKRKYEFLKLYLRPGDSKEISESNALALSTAETIRHQRIVEYHAGKIGIRTDENEDCTLMDYIRNIIDRKEGTTKTSWKNCLAHVNIYCRNKDIPIKEIDKKWVEGFRDYLDKKATAWAIDKRKRNLPASPLSEGSKVLMFQKLCCALNLAFKEGIIDRNPSVAVKRFKEPESDREFLTVEELRHLISVPPPDEKVGRAFLFSCLTGLRWSDIVTLRWSMVSKLGDTTRLVFHQQKTGGLEYLDINPQAEKLLGDRIKDSDLIFPGLTAIQTIHLNRS